MTVAPEGRKLLRLEVRNAETPIERKPPWIKTRAKMGPEYKELKALVRREGLHTVCEEAGCPNIFECWEDREATFLIGGEQCTRRCDFCQIDTGKPAELDRDEPRRVAESVQAMGLRYSTVTGVARDDLPDGGAWLYAETVRAIKKLNPNTGVELLIPDFNGEPALLEQVFEVAPRSVGAQRRNGAAHLQADPARRSATSAASRCSPRPATTAWSPSPTSSSAWARRPTRCAPRCAICTTPAATSSRSPSTCGRRCATTRSSAGSSPRSSSSTSSSPNGLGFAGVLAGPLVRSSYRAGRLYAQAAGSGVAAHPYPELMAKPRDPAADEGRQGRGEGGPQGGLQAAPQPAVAGVPDPAQRGQAPPALHDRRVRADRGGLGGVRDLRRRVSRCT